MASEAARGLLRLPRWSAEQGRPVQKGSLASPSHHDRLRLQLDDVHRQLTYTREIANFYRTHFRCLQISPRTTWRSTSAIEESLATTSYHLRGPSPTSHRVSSPDAAPPWSSFSNAAWIPVQAGLDPLHMTARVR